MRFVLAGIYLPSRERGNLSHLGKGKIIFKNVLVGDMLVPRRVYMYVIKGSLDAKLPSYELLKMLKVIDS